MTFALAAILAAAPFGFANTADYPAAAVLDGFAEVCRTLESREGTALVAEKAGWEKFTPALGSELAAVVDFIFSERSALVSDRGGELLSPLVLRRTISGEELVLVVSEGAVNGNQFLSCFAFDMGEKREIDGDVLAAWMKRVPDQILNDPAMTGRTWRPGLESSHRSFTALFIPENSPAIDLMKMSGIGLRADVIRKSEQ